MSTGESTLRPVFLDVGGVRSKRARLSGRVVALVLVAYLLLSVAAVLGVPWVPRVSLPGLGPVVPGVGPGLPPPLGPAAVAAPPAGDSVVDQAKAPAATPAPPLSTVGGAASTVGGTPNVNAPGASLAPPTPARALPGPPTVTPGRSLSSPPAKGRSTTATTGAGTRTNRGQAVAGEHQSTGN